MEKLKEELSTLSKERIFVEFKKALASTKPSLFFEVLRKANILQVHFKEIADLIGKTQPEKYHPEGDSYEHTLIVVDNSAKMTNDLTIRFSCLVHDLGKGVTPKEILPHHYGHDEKGVELIAKLGKRIGIPKVWEKCGKTACKWHMKAGIFEQMTPKKQVELIENVAKSMLGLEGLQIVVACDKVREGNVLEKHKEITFANLGKKLLQNVNGDGIKQKYPELTGEKFKQKLREERIKWLKGFYKIYNKV
jgi:tRNA nucleotidyltransferase (CCA-adding enzyme)